MKSSLCRFLERSSLHRSRAEAEFTDLILNHEAGRFEVHRIIVCPQSKVLYKACTSGFKVEVLFYILNITNVN
jgi:hypothetical protein